MLALQADSSPTNLAEIVCCEPTHLGFCDASGIGAGGVWLDPARMCNNLVWRHPWLADISEELVSTTNPNGTITNSDLKLATLFLQEATLIKAVPKTCMSVTCSGSDNTLTAFWSTREALMINPVVAELFCIHALHPKKFLSNPSISSLPGIEIAWVMILPASFFKLTMHFSPI